MRNRPAHPPCCWAQRLHFNCRRPAQSVADFYKDKQIKIVIATPPAATTTSADGFWRGTWAAISPAIRRWWCRIPGASTVTATNFLQQGAERRYCHRVFLAQHRKPGCDRKDEYRSRSAKIRLDRRLIAAGTRLQWFPPKRRQFSEDVFKREVVVAGSGAGSSLSIVPTALNNLLGTKFKLVEGYRGSNDAMLAVERGEVEGICHTHGVFQSHHAEMVKNGELKILFHVEDTDFPEDPSVPSIYKFAKTEKQKQMLRFLFSSTEFGRPYVTPPGVPAERLAALRKAFADALKDPALIEEASKARSI